MLITHDSNTWLHQHPPLTTLFNGWGRLKPEHDGHSVGAETKLNEVITISGCSAMETQRSETEHANTDRQASGGREAGGRGWKEGEVGGGGEAEWRETGG